MFFKNGKVNTKQAQKIVIFFVISPRKTYIYRAFHLIDHWIHINLK